MSTRETCRRAVAVSLFGVFALTPAIGQDKNVPTARVTTTNSVQQERPSGGPKEGIKVHGHWSIVIKNPDGSVASLHEFENALVGSGSDMLAQLLARSASTGGWGISVVPSASGGSSCGGNLPCVVIESGLTTGVISVSSNLTVVYSPSPSRTTLQGSYQATSAGDIAQVATLVGACPASVAPSSCPNSSNNSGQGTFSSRTLATPLTVQSGQIVQLTVTFTFS
jgi:hypothetical protein